MSRFLSKNLLSGISAVAYVTMTGVGVDTNLLTITDDDGHALVFELDTAANPGTYTAGRIRVNLSAGATSANTATAIALAINSLTTSQNNLNFTPKAILLGTTKVAIFAQEAQVRKANGTIAAASFTLTETLANGTAEATAAGTAAGLGVVASKTHVISAGDATRLFIAIPVEFTPVTAIVQARDATGLALAHSELVTISGKAVVITIGTGGAALVATNILHVVIFGAASTIP